MFPIKNDGKCLVNATLARAILASVNNDLNRPIVDAKVKKYTQDMLLSNWHYNADPIRISADHHLLDGQHRLTAIIEADVEESLYFILNLPTTTEGGLNMFEVIDQETRKPYEILAISHPSLEYCKEITTLVPKLTAFNYRELLTTNLIRPTNKTVTEFANNFMPLTTLDSFVERAYTLLNRMKSNGLHSSLISKDEAILYVATIGLTKRGNEFLEALASMEVDNGAVLNDEGYEADPTDPLAYYLLTINKLIVKGIKTPSKQRILNMFSAYRDFTNEKTASSYKGKAILYPEDYPNYNE